jgi:hypothetical protein
MKLRLPREAKRGSGIERQARHPSDALDFDARPPRRVELLVEDRAVLARQAIEIAVEPLERAVDALVSDDRLSKFAGRSEASATVRAPSAPNRSSISKYRSSGGIQCAVVRPLSPAASSNASSNTTRLPDLARR